MPLYAWVAIGSAAGGLIRFLLGTLIQQKTGSTFPIGTLAINAGGSLVLGFLLRYALGTPAVSAEMRALLTAGFCGGFTTFSTFGYEAARLLQDGQAGRAGVYMLASALGSVAAALAGFRLAATMLGRG